MITETERKIIQNYMQAVADQVTSVTSLGEGTKFITPQGETMTVEEANHKYGQVLNAADDALRVLLGGPSPHRAGVD